VHGAPRSLLAQPEVSSRTGEGTFTDSPLFLFISRINRNIHHLLFDRCFRLSRFPNFLLSEVRMKLPTTVPWVPCPKAVIAPNNFPASFSLLPGRSEMGMEEPAALSRVPGHPMVTTPPLCLDRSPLSVLLGFKFFR
jgi:hypothetical protein